MNPAKKKNSSKKPNGNEKKKLDKLKAKLVQQTINRIEDEAQSSEDSPFYSDDEVLSDFT